MGFINKISNLLRVKDFIAFTIPVTLFGYGAGILQYHLQINLIAAIILVIANCSAVGFAFVINEIEDYEDDGKKIDIKFAKSLAFVTVLISIISYFFLGVHTFLIGILILILGFLYSWKKVRLKAYPIVDLVSHSLMLGGLLFLAGFYISGINLDRAVFLFFAVILASVYGQFYNQVRDFSEDKKAGLNNTSILIGKGFAKILMYTSAILTLILIIYAFYINILPWWFIFIGSVILFVLIYVFKNTKIALRDKKSGIIIVNYHSSIRITLTILAIIYILIV